MPPPHPAGQGPVATASRARGGAGWASHCPQRAWPQTVGRKGLPPTAAPRPPAATLHALHCAWKPWPWAGRELKRLTLPLRPVGSILPTFTWRPCLLEEEIRCPHLARPGSGMGTSDLAGEDPGQDRSQGSLVTSVKAQDPLLPPALLSRCFRII